MKTRKKNHFNFITIVILAMVAIGAITALIIFNNTSGIIVGRAVNRFMTNQTPALSVAYHKNDGSLDINTRFSSKIDAKSQKSGINGTIELEDSYTGISGELRFGGMRYDDRLYYKIEGLGGLTTANSAVSSALNSLNIEAGEFWTQFDATSLSDFLTKIDGSANAECGTVLTKLLERQLSSDVTKSDLQKILREDFPFAIQNELGATEDGLLHYEIGATSTAIMAYFTKIANSYGIDSGSFQACFATPEEDNPVTLDIFIKNGLIHKTLEKVIIKNDLWTLTVTEIAKTDFNFDDFDTMTTLGRNNTVFARLVPKVKTALSEAIFLQPEYQERVTAESDDSDDSACNDQAQTANKIQREVQQRVDERWQIGVLLKYE
ncbi:MAG: hypothetical protein LBQ02_02745 [Candidatus Nomurabacteria bacterium]|jgi:hypothetical protein|nr:hypothetical protein [Candidatus Nomurabacteria bacterium]